MISLAFSNVHIDGPTPTKAWQRFLWIVADFTITQYGREIFKEPEFPIVELAYYLREWLSSSASEHLPFNYESIESAEPALLWFRPVGGDWSMGYSDEHLLSGLELTELERAAARFVDRVVEEVPRQVGVEVKDLVAVGPNWGDRPEMKVEP